MYEAFLPNLYSRFTFNHPMWSRVRESVQVMGLCQSTGGVCFTKTETYCVHLRAEEYSLIRNTLKIINNGY